MAKKIKVV